MVLIGTWDNWTLRIILFVSIVFIMLVFWGWQYRDSKNKFSRIACCLSIVGFTMNFIVILANGGYMPSLGRLHYDGSLWIPMLGTTNYNWLGDRFMTGIGYASIGDFLIWIGIFLYLILMPFNHRRLKEEGKQKEVKEK